MLIAHNISCRRKGRTLIAHADLCVRPGEAVGLVAPNGAGKTTLLNALMGDRNVLASGHVTVGGRAPRSKGQLYEHLFYVPGDASNLYPHLTPLDHLRLVKEHWPSPASIERVISVCGIGDFAHKRVRSLSSGMKQQTALALAYCSYADYLLLDEPMNALDPLQVQRHTDLVRRYVASGKRGALISSHLMDNMDALCDRIVCIDQGRLRELGHVDDAREAYLGIYS